MNERTHKTDQSGYWETEASLSHVMSASSCMFVRYCSCRTTILSPSFLTKSSFTLRWPTLSRDCILVVMSTQNNHLAETLQHRPYPHLQSNDSKDFEASFDTLIDVNGLPYTSNSRHQTFTLATPTTSRLQRGLSVPLSKFSSKQSDDTHETSGSHPPVVSPEVEVPGLWQRVTGIFPFRTVCVSHLPY
jgi:hypothetical protein